MDSMEKNGGRKVRKTFDCFVFDIDGTLIDENLILPPQNAEMIEKLKDMDITVVIASGRMLFAVKKFMWKNFGDYFPCICYNGAVVWTPEDGKIFEVKIDGQTSAKVVDFLRSCNVHRQAYVNDILYAEEDNEWVKSYSEHSDIDYEIVDDLKEFVLKNGSTKLLAIAEDRKLDEVKERAIKLFGDKLEIFKSFPTYLDFTLKGINKGIGLMKLAEHMGIDLNRTVAFGDNENDLSMFEIVGLAVGVGDLDDRLKKKVKMVVEDGPKALASFVLDNIFDV